MKLMFASDIHGSLYFCRKMQELYWKEGAEKLILLGDLLYHGPRNDLPKDYSPKEVTRLLNGMKEELLCVRGNCDAEVDQMVLEFPILSDSLLLYLEGHMAFVTHGHQKNLPAFRQGDLLIHGHTHVQGIFSRETYTYLNPGSVSLPKEGNPESCLFYEDGCFSIRDLEGNVLQSWSL